MRSADVSSARMKYWYDSVVVRKRSDIPHWHVPNGLYFVTWRLADSLPRHVKTRLAEIRKALRTAREADYHGAHARMMEREIFKFTESELDRGRGSCRLRNPQVAALVISILEYRDGVDYDLLAYTLMPNHVHLVFRLKCELHELMKRWKSYTSHEANKILSRTGAFWQADYFDVLMRDSEQLERTIAYVLNNPAKAGLHKWPYARSWPERIHELI